MIRNGGERRPNEIRRNLILVDKYGEGRKVYFRCLTSIAEAICGGIVGRKWIVAFNMW